MSDRPLTRTAATEPLEPDKSLGELFGELTSGMGRLFRDEVQLAKTEAREEVRRAGKAGAMFGVGALAGWMTVLFLSLALAWLLDQAMNTALAFLLVGVLWGVIAAAALASGKKKAKDIEPMPTTVETLKEDAQWAKKPTS